MRAHSERLQIAMRARLVFHRGISFDALVSKIPTGAFMSDFLLLFTRALLVVYSLLLFIILVFSLGGFL